MSGNSTVAAAARTAPPDAGILGRVTGVHKLQVKIGMVHKPRESKGGHQQLGPDLRDLLRIHAGITPRNPPVIPDLTKYY